METSIGITQSMCDAVNEPIEQAVILSDLKGIAFIQVAGGRFAIYNIELKKALRHRFDNLVHARQWAINKIMDKVAK